MSLKKVLLDKLEEDICYWRDWGPLILIRYIR